MKAVRKGTDRQLQEKEGTKLSKWQGMSNFQGIQAANGGGGRGGVRKVTHASPSSESRSLVRLRFAGGDDLPASLFVDGDGEADASLDRFSMPSSSESPPARARSSSSMSAMMMRRRMPPLEWKALPAPRTVKRVVSKAKHGSPVGQQRTQQSMERSVRMDEWRNCRCMGQETQATT